MFAETERDLKKLVGIAIRDAYFATVLTTTGTGANEACLFALAAARQGPDLNNGFFGARVVDQARQNQIDSRRQRVARRTRRSIPRYRRGARARPGDQVGVLRQPRDPHRPRQSVRGDRRRRARRAARSSPPTRSRARSRTRSTSRPRRSTSSPRRARRRSWPRPASASSSRARRPRSRRLDAPQARAAATTSTSFAEYKKQSAEQQPRFAQPVALHAALRAACTHLG